MQLVHVFAEQRLGLVVLPAHEIDHHAVDLGRSLVGAGHGSVAAQIGVLDLLKGDHAEILAHAKSGDVGAGQAGGLLDVVGRARGDRVQGQLLGNAAAGQRCDLVFQLLAAHQVVLLLVDLHGIAQRARGARDDGDLGDRGRVALERRDQGVADLVIGDDELFLVREDLVLFLVAGDDDLDALLQVGLAHLIAAGAHRAQRGLVDHVGQLRARRAGGHAGDCAEVQAGLALDLLGMHAQDSLAADEVGQLDRYAAVKAAGAQQRRVERLGPVGRGQDDHALAAVKAVHLGQELVEGLLALVVAAHGVGAVALFADGIDLIDKDDAGRLLIGLLEQVAHLGRAHADEHLNELRAGDREEGDVGLARDRLGQQRLARAWRADEQGALGDVRADGSIALRVVQEIDDLGQKLLGLVLALHVREVDAGLAGDIDLGVGLAKAHRARAHFLLHRAGHPNAEADDDDERQDGGQEGRGGGRPDLGKVDVGVQQALDEIGVLDEGGHIDLLAGLTAFLLIASLGGKDNAVFTALNLCLLDLPALGHGDKLVVADGLGLGRDQAGQQQVGQKEKRDGDGIKIKYALPVRLFDFFHKTASFPGHSRIGPDTPPVLSCSITNYSNNRL